MTSGVAPVTAVIIPSRRVSLLMTRSTFVNALIGAAVSVVLSVVPFSPVLGGGAAGYLEGRDGVRVGAISGVIAALPLILVFAMFLSVFMFVSEGGVTGAGVLLAVLTVVAMVYSVALSVLGGMAGVYLADHQRAKRESAVVEGTA